MSLVNTKSMLAKLLASENITVEHGNYQTASMDVKNRILPYDTLVGTQKYHDPLSDTFQKPRIVYASLH